MSACGLMSRMATKPSVARHVVAFADELAEEAVVVHAASTPSSETAAPRTATSSPTARGVDEPRRVVVAVALAGPVDEHESSRPIFVRQRARHASCEAARRRAPRSFFSCGDTGSSTAVTRARARRVREDVHLRQTGGAHRVERRRERALVLGREADDHVARQVELLLQRREPAQVRRDGVAAAHRAEDGVVAGLQRHVQMRLTVGVSRSAAISASSRD